MIPTTQHLAHIRMLAERALHGRITDMREALVDILDTTAPAIAQAEQDEAALQEAIADDKTFADLAL